MMPLTIIVFTEGKENYTEILRKILRSDLDKSQYEIIFLGQSLKGFQQTTISKVPLVRAFYDDTLSKAQKINGAVAEAHCPSIMLWPGIYFSKARFEPLPKDIVDPLYYLHLENILDDANPYNKGFGKVNLPDTLRLWYLLGKKPCRIQAWFYRYLLLAIWLRIIRRA